MSRENHAERERNSLSEERLSALGRALAQDLPDAVVLADCDNIIQYWNAGAERIFGFSAREATGKSLDIIIPERLRERHMQGFQQMVKTGHTRHGPEELLSVPAVTKNGDTISVQFTLAPLLDSNGQISSIAAVLRDVTDTFSELRRLRKAAR